MKLSKRVGTMAVVIDEESEKTEFLSVDQVALVSFVINGLTGVAQFALVFGGVDSTGKFHIDPNRASEVAHITMTREGQPEAFDKLFCDDMGNPKTHYPQEFFDSLCADLLLPGAHKQIWGAKYPDMEIKNAEKVIFTTAKPEQAEAQGKLN